MIKKIFSKLQLFSLALFTIFIRMVNGVALILFVCVVTVRWINSAFHFINIFLRFKYV